MMAELSRSNPTGRFTGLADIYAKCRPGYPEAAVDFIVACCRLGRSSVLVDVGCGTGISTRLFARRGVSVVGIDPNDEMRGRAEAEAADPGSPPPVYRKGTAEATGLPGGYADAVLAAQAFHWFEPEAALAEFHRILKPGGWAVLIWNERDEADAFTAAYGAVVRSTGEAAAVEVPRGQAGEVLLRSDLFLNAQRALFDNEQVLDEEGVLGRALSASYAPCEPAQRADFTTALREVFARFQNGGQVILKYQTKVYLGQRRGGAPPEAK
jgi:SAM-dependent methyltransferase